MTKLDRVLARIKELPPERQEWVAVEIEFLLDDLSESALSEEQWTEVEAGLAREDADEIPHAQVVRETRAKFGE